MMNESGKMFLIGAVGVENTKALLKSVERNPTIEAYVVPRTALVWLSLASRDTGPTEVPGLEGTHIQFRKSGDVCEGTLYTNLDKMDFSTTLDTLALTLSETFNSSMEEVAETKLTAHLAKALDVMVQENFQKLVKVAVNDSPATDNMTPSLPRWKPQAAHSTHGPAVDGKATYHHVLSGPEGPAGKSVTHTISHSANPYSEKHVLASMHGNLSSVGSLKEAGAAGKAPWTEGKAFLVGTSAVHPTMRGKGIGQALYNGALYHHGRMLSDSSVSTGATNTWSKMLQKPGVEGVLGGSHPDDVHWAQMPHGDMLKVEPSSMSAAPQGANKPIPPEGASRSKKASPNLKIPKIQKLGAGTKSSLPKLTMSERSFSCPTCGMNCSIAAGKMNTCICWRDLRGDVTLKKTESGTEVSFGPRWDAESYDLFSSEWRRPQS